MIDQIGGWSSGKIGEGYGDGHELATVSYFLTQLQIKTGRTEGKNLCFDVTIVDGKQLF